MLLGGLSAWLGYGVTWYGLCGESRVLSRARSTKTTKEATHDDRTHHCAGSPSLPPLALSFFILLSACETNAMEIEVNKLVLKRALEIAEDQYNQSFCCTFNWTHVKMHNKEMVDKIRQILYGLQDGVTQIKLVD
jgi:hypothetical protein